jgi:hydrogenase maturation protease
VETEHFIQMKTVVIGLGNPILGDDGVGWSVAENVSKQLRSSPTPLLLGEENDVEVDCLSLGGIRLMERLIGYERAILIDAFVSDDEPGLILVSKLEDIPNYSAFHIASAHDASLQNAMKLGRELGAKLPEDVMVIGIAASHRYDFSEELSPAIEQAVPRATQIVVGLLKQNIIIQ